MDAMRDEPIGVDWPQILVVGILATHIMTMVGFWQAGLGLPKMDVGQMLAGNMERAYGWGQLAHYLNGIVLAAIYARWLRQWMPGNAFTKGLSYGLVTTVAAAAVVAPLAGGTGIFFTNTPNPGLMLVGSLVGHLAYGVALGLGYRPEEGFLAQRKGGNAHG